jgi:hypothetical protein
MSVLQNPDRSEIHVFLRFLLLYSRYVPKDAIFSHVRQNALPGMARAKSYSLFKTHG